MGRKKRLSEDAEAVTFYLTPEEQLVLQVIRVRRKKRSEERTSPSEIIADALWRQLTDVEKVQRETVEALSAVESNSTHEDTIKQFPKKDSSR